MSNQAVVADAVQSLFTLSADQSESLAVAAEKVVDSGFDFRDGCEMVAEVFKPLIAAGLLTYAVWEVVRTRFVAVAASRARDNGAADPNGAGDDSWGRVAGYLKEFHGLTKPKSAEKESVAKAEKRAAEKAKALQSAGGKSAAELKSEIKSLYGEASDDSIAQAKALEKALKVVESAEKDAITSQMKPLKSAADAKHKEILELLKSDPKRMGDYVVLLSKTYDIWVEQSK